MAKEITLTAAMRANLVSLQNTEVLLNRTQERLATGKKVNSALDNPLNYFAAAAHTERANQLITRKDGMGEAIQTIKAANNGIEGIKSLLENLRGLVEAARSSTDTSVQQGQANEVVSQIIQLVQDSGYKGVNFLNGTAVSLDVLFNETGSNKLMLTGFVTISVSGTMSGMSGISNGSLISTSMSSIAFSAGSILAAIDSAITSAMSALSSQASKLSSNLAIINARLDFTNQMVNTLKEGADKLTLADTNEEGANMLALQTRQQLGVTSLSLASQAAQSVLRLFG
jgi:flagellin-like hook-associated protein FlgL